MTLNADANGISRDPESGKLKLFARTFGVLKLYHKPGSEFWNESGKAPKHDFKLRRDVDGKWYLLLLMDKERDVRTEAEGRKIALDPGVRVFQTGYCPQDCEVIDIGSNAQYRMEEQATELSSLNRKIATLQKERRAVKTRVKAHARAFPDRVHERAGDRKLMEAYRNRIRHTRRKIRLLNKRSRNLIDDLHWKTAHYLCKQYDAISIGKLGVSSCVRKTESRRKIGKQTARAMLGVRHYTFRQRLVEKSKEFGTHVTEQDEAYTSKTCGKCGVLNDKLGGSKTFKCGSCGVVLDRDANGARNIYVRSSVEDGTFAGG